MRMIHPQYITDDKGKKISVVISMEEYQIILNDLEDIRAYDKAKTSDEPSVPIDEAFRIIEGSRNRK